MKIQINKKILENLIEGAMCARASMLYMRVLKEHILTLDDAINEANKAIGIQKECMDGKRRNEIHLTDAEYNTMSDALYVLEKIINDEICPIKVSIDPKLLAELSIFLLGNRPT